MEYCLALNGSNIIVLQYDSINKTTEDYAK